MTCAGRQDEEVSVRTSVISRLRTVRFKAQVNATFLEVYSIEKLSKKSFISNSSRRGALS